MDALICLTPNQLEERRLAACKMLRAGRAQAEVARGLDVTSGAVAHWVKAMDEGGEDALKRRPHTGRRPRLGPKQRERLAEMLVEGARAHVQARETFRMRKAGRCGCEAGSLGQRLDVAGQGWARPYALHVAGRPEGSVNEAMARLPGNDVAPNPRHTRRQGPSAVAGRGRAATRRQSPNVDQ